jgi:hypothetical protein
MMDSPSWYRWCGYQDIMRVYFLKVVLAHGKSEAILQRAICQGHNIRSLAKSGSAFCNCSTLLWVEVIQYDDARGFMGAIQKLPKVYMVDVIHITK